ncbi:MAG: hypothetical protein ACK46C_01630, partial [Flavobacteriales bacterium]
MLNALHRLLFVAFMALSMLPLSAQSAGATDPASSKRAAELMKQADRAAQAGPAQFVHAETLFEEALKLDPDNVELNTRMGLCQLNGPHRHKALAYFIKAQELAPDQPRIHFLTGYAYQLNAQWDNAIACYERHKRANVMPDTDPRYNMADKHLAECRNGRTFMGGPVQAEVRGLGTDLNSDRSDYGALLSADGNTLWFTSRRKLSDDAKVNKATGDHFEEILVSRLVNGQWTAPVPEPAPLNTPGNDASVGLLASDGTMILYRDMKGKGDLFECHQLNGQWSAPVPFGPAINSAAHESSAWLSADRQWIYFVSDRPDDNVGGQDIYRSRWDATLNAWGPAENLG